MLMSFFINSQCREAGEDRRRLGVPFFKLLQCASIEDNGFIAVTKDAMLEVPSDAAGQYGTLQIAAFLDEVLFIAYLLAHYVLLAWFSRASY